MNCATALNSKLASIYPVFTCFINTTNAGIHTCVLWLPRLPLFKSVRLICIPRPLKSCAHPSCRLAGGPSLPRQVTRSLFMLKESPGWPPTLAAVSKQKRSQRLLLNASQSADTAAVTPAHSCHPGTKLLSVVFVRLLYVRVLVGPPKGEKQTSQCRLYFPRLSFIVLFGFPML